MSIRTYPTAQDVADQWTNSVYYRVEVMPTGEKQTFVSIDDAKAFAKRVRRTFHDPDMFIRLVTVTETVQIIP
jgi:hypothetical protein